MSSHRTLPPAARFSWPARNAASAAALTLGLTAIAACDPMSTSGDAGARSDAPTAREDAGPRCSDRAPILETSGAWASAALPTVASGEARIELLARTSRASTDAVVGLGATPAGDFADLPIAFRFADTGQLEARDGASYRAETSVTYVADEWYALAITVHFSSATYDVEVGRCGEAPVALVTDAHFRADSGAIGSASSLSAWTDGTSSVEVAELRVSSTSCVPLACASACGAVPDGCGGTLDCGPCDAGPAADAGPPPAVRYGPTGTRWPSRTPRCESPRATLSSWPEIVSALATANAGDVFQLAAGTYEEHTLNEPAVRTRAETWTASNVLLCAAPGAEVVLLATTVEVPHTTWSDVSLGGFFSFGAGAHHGRLARSKVIGSTTLFVRSADDIELVEVVALERGMNGDRMDISAARPGAPNPHDLLFDGCWLEGTSVTLAGEHSDTIQFLSIAGTVTFRNTYIGPAGNNASIQAGAEFQGAEPYAAFDFHTVFLGGAEELGNGNVFGTGNPTTYDDVEWDVNLRARADSLPVASMTRSRIETADPRYPDGRSIREAFPDNEYGVTVEPPSFVPPPWW